ncbi:MAG: DUF5606 domain-containing protein [Nonlabens sp.]
MGLEEILSVTGKPGLFKLKTRAKSGFIVTSLLDDKTTIIGMNQNVSVLKDISIYTETAEISLKNVFQKIAEKESNGPSINHKSSKEELQAYFKQVVPDYDTDRVYASDIKKVVQWYNILEKNQMIDAFQEEE